MRFIFTFYCILFCLFAGAQRCSSLLQPQLLFSQHNAAREGLAKGKVERDTIKDEIITIPVIVHVLYNNEQQNISTAQILSQIDALNKDYRRQNADASKTPEVFKSVAADTKIVFCLTKIDPKGNSTNGILRKFTNVTAFNSDDAMKFSVSGGDEAWDASKYLNIWICNLSGNSLGYSVLPGAPADRDGVVIKYSAFGTTGNVRAPYNKGRTATHEIGHWLGLQHLWGDADCGDDGIADTPPQQTANNLCPVFPHRSSCSVNAFGDMFMNFMDFTDDACMNMFTTGQKNKMRSLFALGSPRNSFLDAAVCDSTKAENAPLPDLEPKKDSLLITIYPNPFVNAIHIEAKNTSDILGKTIKLYSVSGKLHASKVANSSKTVFNVANLPSGMYLLKVEGEPYIYRLIK